MSLIHQLNLKKGDAEKIRRLLAAPGKAVHLVGIGGIGMGGLAVHLASRGLKVSGCDLVPNRVTDWLEAQGIPVAVGHSRDHVTADLGWVIRSAAVSDDTTELVVARQHRIPISMRGEVLPRLLEGRFSVAVSGTHGKTTTSSMVAQVLARAGLKPGFCIGGEIDPLGGVAGAGDGRYLVVEADESDGTVIYYEPDIAIITNIEYDHMEHFEDEETLVGCFETFAGNTRRRLIYCSDDPRASEVGRRISGSCSYGFSKPADMRGTDAEERSDSVSFSVLHKNAPLGQITLPVPGIHNAWNALAACAACLEIGLPFSAVQDGLRQFVHARRRFEKICEKNGILVISDYAHHPTEIRALIRTAAQLGRKRLIAVFQPHRYTRTRALGRDFPPAFEHIDELVLVPVYEASEAPLPGGTSDDLYKHFVADGKITVRNLASLEESWKYLRARLQPGDLLLIIGAGDVEKIAQWAGTDL